jgi:PAS domain S-box-containing protein
LTLRDETPLRTPADAQQHRKARAQELDLQRALRASEERYRTLVTATTSLVWVAAPDGAFVEPNAPWEEYTGQAWPVYQGDGWIDAFHPDDRLQLGNLWRQARVARSLFEGRGRLWHASSTTYRYCVIRGAPVANADGSLREWVGTLADIHEYRLLETERAQLYAAAEQARERQAFLAEASRLLAESLDYAVTLERTARMCVPRFADLCVVFLLENTSLRRVAVAHCDPQGEAQLRRLQQDVIALDDPHPVACVARTGRLDWQATLDQALFATMVEGDALEVADALQPRSHIIMPLVVRRAVIGVVAFGYSVSGRAYAAADVEVAAEIAARAAQAIDNARLYQQAQEAVLVRDSFLSIAAHELKTPLTALYGQAQLLQRRMQREAVSEPNQRTIGIVVEQASRLSELISDLLDLSRIEAGQLQIQLSPLDLSALTQRVAKEVELTLSRHQISYCLPTVPVLVAGDALRLEQVLQNLLQNAAKYSPAGGAITITLTTEGDRARLAVADQGIGIPQSALPQLFTRFYRAPNAEGRNISGVGVGLYVVKEIVTRHGGEVAVTSVEGQGSTFTVMLPLHQA